MDEWHETWRGLRTGEPAAFEFLLDRLGRAVWGYLRRMAGRDDLADELFSRTWLRLVQTAGRIKSPRAIRQYVLSIARRQWLDELARRQRDVLDQAEDDGADAIPQDATPSALEALAHEEDAERLRGAIDRLPESQREVIALRIAVDLTFRQIAEVLNLPLGTVLTRMRLATHRLAGELESGEPSSDAERNSDEPNTQPKQAANRSR